MRNGNYFTHKQQHRRMKQKTRGEDLCWPTIGRRTFYSYIMHSIAISICDANSSPNWPLKIIIESHFTPLMHGGLRNPIECYVEKRSAHLFRRPMEITTCHDDVVKTGVNRSILKAIRARTPRVIPSTTTSSRRGTGNNFRHAHEIHEMCSTTRTNGEKHKSVENSSLIIFGVRRASWFYMPTKWRKNIK